MRPVAVCCRLRRTLLLLQDESGAKELRRPPAGLPRRAAPCFRSSRSRCVHMGPVFSAAMATIILIEILYIMAVSQNLIILNQDLNKNIMLITILLKTC